MKYTIYEISKPSDALINALKVNFCNLTFEIVRYEACHPLQEDEEELAISVNTDVLNKEQKKILKLQISSFIDGWNSAFKLMMQ